MTSQIWYCEAMQADVVDTLPRANTLKNGSYTALASLDKKISSKQDPTAPLSTIADVSEALNINERHRRLIKPVRCM